VCSAALIAFNKHLVNDDRFPFPAALGLLHASFCALMAAVLYVVKPSLFPSLTDPEKKVNLNDGVVFKTLMPIAVLFSLQIVLSNQAYLFANVAFLQMLKETNLVYVYILSIAFALEVFKWRHMRILILIVMSSFMCVKGEAHLTMAGLLIQGASCFVESAKITLQGLMLSGGRGLDAMSFMLVVMPVCASIFGGILLFCSLVFPGQAILPMPALSDWVTCRWLLLANASVALLLNISTLVFIKCSSALAYVMAGIVKDVCIVMTSIVFMGSDTTMLQMAGFTLQMCFICAWSLLKTFPKECENSLFEGIQIIFFGSPGAKAKQDPEITSQHYGTVDHKDSRLTLASCPHSSKV